MNRYFVMKKRICQIVAIVMSILTVASSIMPVYAETSDSAYERRGAQDVMEIDDDILAAGESTTTDIANSGETAASLQSKIDSFAGPTKCNPDNPYVLNITGDVELNAPLKIGTPDSYDYYHLRYVRITGGGRLKRAEGYKGSLIMVYKGRSNYISRLFLDDITIDGFSDDMSGSYGALISSSGYVYMGEGTKICNNFGRGAVNSGTFVMEGGEITGNNNISDTGMIEGGGIANFDLFEMRGGVIKGNETSLWGNEVYNNGEVRLSGRVTIGKPGSPGGLCTTTPYIGVHVVVEGELDPDSFVNIERIDDVYYAMQKSIAKKASGVFSDAEVACFGYLDANLKIARDEAEPNTLRMVNYITSSLQQRIDDAAGSTLENPEVIALSADTYIDDTLVVGQPGAPRHIKLTGYSLDIIAALSDVYLRVSEGSSLSLEDIVLSRNGRLIPFVRVEQGGTLRLGKGAILRGNRSGSWPPTIVEGSAIHNSGSCYIAGGQITENDGPAVYNAADGFLSMTSGAIEDNYGRGVTNLGRFDFSGGAIGQTDITVSTNNWKSDAYSMGGGILNQGTLNLSGSATILQNVALQGGGIFNQGTLNLSGSATILQNRANQGGGVYNSGEMFMSGGSITVNKVGSGDGITTRNGGGVFNEGRLVISGGEIENNTVGWSGENNGGGGVYSIGQMVMQGGRITGNSALKGGGVCIGAETGEDGGTHEMSGGQIVGNMADNGQEVLFNPLGVGFFLSGTPIIGCETSDGGIKQARIYTQRLAITGPLTRDAYIKVETPALVEAYPTVAVGKDYRLTLIDKACFEFANGDALWLDKFDNTLKRTSPGSVHDMDISVRLDRKYLLLPQGEQVQLRATLSEPAPLTLKYAIRACSSPNLILLDEDTGAVTASGNMSGTAIVRVYCAEVPTISAECRIEVAASDDEAVTAPYHLAAENITVNTKRLEGVELPLWQEAAKEGTCRGGLSGMQLEFAASGGAKTQKAADTLNQAFTIEAIDEYTLRLNPRSGLSRMKLASSYKVKIKVVDGDFLAPEALTVKTSRKLPTLTAAPITINYYETERSFKVQVDGATATDLVLDPAKKSSNNKIIGTKGWLSFQDGTVTLVREQKKSGTLRLLAKVEGWAEVLPIKVPVKAVYAPPALKLSATTIQIYKWYGGGNQVDDNVVYLRPKNAGETLASFGVYDMRVVKQSELTAEQAKTYKLQPLFTAPRYGSQYKYDAKTGRLFLESLFRDEVENIKQKDGKLLLSCWFYGNDEPLFLDLKVDFVNRRKATSWKLNDSSISLNPNLAGGDAGKVILTTNPGVYDPYLESSVYIKKGGRYYYYEYNPLNVSYSDDRGGSYDVDIRTNAYTEYGKTYYVFLSCNDGYSSSRTKVVTVKTAGWNVLPSATLSVKGDVNLSTGKGAVVSAIIKNCGMGFSQENPLVIRSPSGDIVTEKFVVTPTVTNRWAVTPNYNYDVQPGTYTVSAMGSTSSGYPISSIRESNLVVKASAVKVKPKTAALTLYRKDPYSEAILELDLPDGVPDIAEVYLTGNTSASYDIEQIDTNRYALYFANHSPDTAEHAKPGTLILHIKLKGITSAKPGATIKIKVILK